MGVPQRGGGSADVAVEVDAVGKRFGDTVALRDVSFSILPGTVHGLVGENGAGKSTLSRVIFGMMAPDTGTVRFPLTAPDESGAGVGMVHQHFAQAPSMTVLENFALSRRMPHEARMLQRRAVGRRATELAGRLGFTLDLGARVDRLTVGARQRVEIVKALQHGARILLLDEPTGVLSPSEIEALIELMRSLAAQGTAIVFVSHKLEEVLAACDAVTVMRRGEAVATLPREGLTARSLARMMTGADPQRVAKPAVSPGPELLRATGIHARDDRGALAVRGVDLSVRGGEIVGIAAIEGNGQEEFVEALAGVREIERGVVHVSGEIVGRAAERRERRSGLAHIPADRLRTGAAPRLSLEANLVAAAYRATRFARGPFVRRQAWRAAAVDAVAAFDVRGGGPSTPIGMLSGGNIQKVIVARELGGEPVVLLAAHPTRGVDLRAIETIHAQLVGARQDGRAVLLLSSELDELLALSDRLLVFARGEVVAELDPASTNPAEIGLYMMGAGSRPSDEEQPAVAS